MEDEGLDGLFQFGVIPVVEYGGGGNGGESKLTIGERFGEGVKDWADFEGLTECARPLEFN